MNQLKSTLIFTMLFVSLFVGIIGYSGPASADIQGDWVEEIIRDIPSSVRGIAIGDVDLDGKSEVVVGLSDTSYELRMYKKEGGLWKETLIADTPVGINNIVVGDADNDQLSEIVVTMNPTVNEVRMYEIQNGIWIEENITDVPVQVYSLALGDANNDGGNEVVIGLADTTYDVRAYQKSATWVEENIADVNHDVAQVDVGDADNDGKNEVVIGMSGNNPPFTYITNEVRAYEKSGGNWIEDNITDTGNLDINSLVVGDADSDSKNEVCFGTWGVVGGSMEARTYEYKWGGWQIEYFIPAAAGNTKWIGGVGDTDNDDKNELIIMEGSYMGFGTCNLVVWENISQVIYGDQVASNLPIRPQTAIGDCDSDGLNEIAVGLITSSYEVRLYSNDRGNIRFTSHYDGEYVAGTEIIDVMVTSNFVDAVRFYIDNNLTFTDTKYPYQLVLDTSTLVEDATYAIKAEGMRIGNGPLVATIDLRVNNLAPVGDYISVSTSRSKYAPDEDVSVLIGLKSAPSFSFLDLYIKYQDPSGNTLYSISKSMPYSNQYMIVLPLGSDAELGTYMVTVDAYGITQDMMMWSASNTTTFDVSGRSIQEQLNEINVTMADINVTELFDSIDLMNLSLSSEIQNSLVNITDDISGLNGSLSEQLLSILENITLGHDSLQTWLDTVLTQIDANITGAKNSLEVQLTALETTTQTFYDDILMNLSEVFNSLGQLEGNLSLQHTAISNAIYNLNTTIANAPGLSIGDITDRINDSIAILEDLDANMTSHDSDIQDVLEQLRILVGDEGNLTRDQLLQNVTEILGQMQDVDDDITTHDDEVKGNLSVIEDLIGNIGAMDISDIMMALADLEGNLTQIDNNVAQDVADIGQDVEGFQTEMESRLDVINAILEDLEKLEDIVADLEALENDIATGIQQLEDEINEIPTEKEEKEEEGFGITEGLLIVVILLLLVNLLLMIMGRGKPKEGGPKALPDEDQVPIDEDEGEEDFEDEGEEDWEEEELEEEPEGEDWEDE